MPRIKFALCSVLDLVDEILVADQKSTDGTCEYCRAQGARVISLDSQTVLNLGFSNLRNCLINQARNEYILILDSDEIISSELKKKIRQLFKEKKDHAFRAYQFYSYSFLNRKRIRGFEGYTFPRFFDRRFCRFAGFVHEKVIVNGNICQLREPLYHVPYESLAENREKAFLYGYLYSKEIPLERNSYFYEFKDISKDLVWGLTKQHAWLDGRLCLFLETSMMKSFIWAYALSRKEK